MNKKPINEEGYYPPLPRRYDQKAKLPITLIELSDISLYLIHRLERRPVISISEEVTRLFERSSEERQKAKAAAYRGDAPAAVRAHEDLATLYHMRALARVIAKRKAGTVDGLAHSREDQSSRGE